MGALYWYRLVMPFRELAKNEDEVSFVPGVDFDAGGDGAFRIMDAEGSWHDDCDVVVFQRWMHIDAPGYIRRAVASGQVVLNDVDDDLFSLPLGNRERQRLDPKRNPTTNIENYREALKASSGIICSTAQLARSLGRLGPPVAICRNAIDIDRWPVFDPADKMVGWVGALPWRGSDFSVLSEVIGPYLDDTGEAFYHGGHMERPGVPHIWQQLGISHDQVRATPVQKFSLYPALWGHVGVAVIPLTDTPFNRAKSWLKGLEASACGLPFIASRLPEYELLGCGRLAKRRGEWLDHLYELRDPDLRREEGARNRKRAEELSIERQWPQWSEALTTLGVPCPA